MDCTLKEVAVKQYHYKYHYKNHHQLREHLYNFLNAYNFAR